MLTHVSEKGITMVDITGKPPSSRSATAIGTIELSKDTITLIADAKSKKGDVLAAAQVAGIMAVKRTSDLIPLCHQVPLDGISVTFDVHESSIDALCSVSSRYATGVEMEALVGVTHALLTIWDMVKANEKDECGQYPSTRMTDIRVLKKEKR